MTGLLDEVLAAHGGLENWHKVPTIDLRLSMAGRLLDVKGHPDGLSHALVKIDARTPRTLISPFPHQGQRGLFADRAVEIRSDAGDMLSRLDQPRASFAGHERTTPWTDLQFLYFIGYAFWNYFTAPFLLARDGVVCREGGEWREFGQVWRILDVTVPETLDTHCAEQRFYVGEDGLFRRQDYVTDVGRGVAAHYMGDHRVFDGFVFPTRRRVVPRNAEDHAAFDGPSTFLLDIDTVVVTSD
jgi:hypothetical protein